jgi:hypothetical protein
MSQFTGSEADTIRMLVATDNHVGYEERDPIRKDDSWQTFDEIMTLARTQDVGAIANPRLGSTLLTMFARLTWSCSRETYSTRTSRQGSPCSR